MSFKNEDNELIKHAATVSFVTVLICAIIWCLAS